MFQAFSSEELQAAKKRVEQLENFQKVLDDCWKGIRWTMDIITAARDKSIKTGLALDVLEAPPPTPQNSPDSDRKSRDFASSACSDAGYHSDWSSHLDNSIEQTSAAATTSSSSLASPGHVTARSNQSSNCADCESNRSPACHQHGRCTHSTPEISSQQQELTSAILRVHSAYDTGLAHGTNVKLQVTSSTTSREVINLVVQQLNMAVLNKGLQGPVYSIDDMEDFCLVAVIGARERVLRDDFQPLHLQNPWTKGRLFVRQKTNLLAALEHGQVTNV